MSRRVTVPVRLVGAGLATLVAVGSLVAVAPTVSAADAAPIDRARAAAASAAYTGTVTVRWLDRAVVHTETMQVRAGGGVVRFEGAAKLAATSSQRWLFRDGDWDLMSPVGVGHQDVDATAKYRYATATGPTVAGRPTQTVDLTADGWRQERLYLDQATGLLLRRQQFDRAGAEVRSVTFDAITLGGPATVAAPTAPGPSVDLRPHATTATKAPYVAPVDLPAGYRRTALFTRGKTLQVVYSDGVHGLSVFEQKGRLARSSVPAGGRPVQVGASSGWFYVYGGGQVVMWQAGASTYTLVGDGAADEMLLAARSLPPGRSMSMGDRLRRACGDILHAVG